MTMIKRMVVLTAPQLAWLEREAKRLGGISVNELVRRIVDKERENKPK